jgi:hypothetical protein
VRPGLLLAGALSVLLVVGVGCSSSSKAKATTTTSTAPAAEGSTTGGAATATGGLSGTWSGSYHGAAEGTFTLTWQQSGSELTGTIDLSDTGTSDISGSVNGSDIHFGTLGGGAITYSGSVSGDSMSGSYTSPIGNGSWTATKSS